MFWCVKIKDRNSILPFRRHLVAETDIWEFVVTFSYNMKDSAHEGEK